MRMTMGIMMMMRQVVVVLGVACSIIPKCSTGRGQAWAIKDQKVRRTETKSFFMGFNVEMKLSTWEMQLSSFPQGMRDLSLVSKA